MGASTCSPPALNREASCLEASRDCSPPSCPHRPDSLRRKPPFYRVLLHNDNYNKREYVVRVLLKVVEGYTVEDAVNVMQEAHRNGLALVTQCAQEVAERYCESMRLSGLIATIEPAGPSGKAA